jgi:hypothetical protein
MAFAAKWSAAAPECVAWTIQRHVLMASKHDGENESSHQRAGRAGQRPHCFLQVHGTARVAAGGVRTNALASQVKHAKCCTGSGLLAVAAVSMAWGAQ